MFEKVKNKSYSNFRLSKHYQGTGKLEDMTDAVDFIRKKFEDYAKRRQKYETIRLLQGQISGLHKNSENLELKIDKQLQYSQRNCLIIHDFSENKGKDTDDLVIKSGINIDMKIEQLIRCTEKEVLKKTVTIRNLDQ